MKKYIIALLLAFPTLAFSQAIPFEQKGPVATITTSASYIYGEPLNTSQNHSLWGWSVVPEVNLNKHLGIQADFASYYMQSVYPGQSRFLMAAGPKFSFATRSRLTPFVFAEGGEMRLTFQRSLYRDWDPVAKAGFGFQYRVSRGIEFTLVPGEFIAHNLDNGSWNQDFTARAGITFNLFR